MSIVIVLGNKVSPDGIAEHKLGSLAGLVTQNWNHHHYALDLPRFRGGVRAWGHAI